MHDGRYRNLRVRHVREHVHDGESRSQQDRLLGIACAVSIPWRRCRLVIVTAVLTLTLLECAYCIVSHFGYLVLPYDFKNRFGLAQ